MKTAEKKSALELIKYVKSEALPSFVWQSSHCEFSCEIHNNVKSFSFCCCQFYSASIGYKTLWNCWPWRYLLINWNVKRKKAWILNSSDSEMEQNQWENDHVFRIQNESQGNWKLFQLNWKFLQIRLKTCQKCCYVCVAYWSIWPIGTKQ